MISNYYIESLTTQNIIHAQETISEEIGRKILANYTRRFGD